MDGGLVIDYEVGLAPDIAGETSQSERRMPISKWRASRIGTYCGWANRTLPCFH